MNNNKARLIAFYLPQYHPIPENDLWWGAGFTEWTNVTKATPLFRGHYQPHIPADLGFYDLRLPEIRLAQAELARKYHIEGFCYWHYWFHGKRLLERPFNEVLASGEPDFPFCLAWANETWSRRWLGEEKDILIQQTYSVQDNFNHAKWLVKVFSDSRYIRVKKRPLFLVYRPLDLPDPQKTTDIFRNECIKNGIPEPYLLGINAHCLHVDCRTLGFDGTLSFEPQLGVLPRAFNDRAKIVGLIRNLKIGVINSIPKIYDYSEARTLMMNHKRGFPVYPCIFVKWDNTPRRGRNSIVIVNSEPENFASGLADVISSVHKKTYEDRLVFINAWNEWAEGNHLEPDLKYGLKYLEVIKKTNSNNGKEC
jgi:lipopolysaccharide biosynthesis protein